MAGSNNGFSFKGETSDHWQRLLSTDVPFIRIVLKSDSAYLEK
jgi:hypothetical protein